MSIDDFLKSDTAKKTLQFTPTPLQAPPAEAPQEPGYMQTGLRSIAQGALGLASGAGDALRWAGEVAGADPSNYMPKQEGVDVESLSLPETLSLAGHTARTLAEKGMGSSAVRLEGPSFEGSFVENPTWKKALSYVGQALPSLALAYYTGGKSAASLRGLGVAAPQALKAGSAVAAAGLGALEGSPQYIEARQAGKSVGEASATGAAATIGTALLEYLPIGKILGEASKGAVRTGLTGVVTEGLQEGTQTVWQNLVTKLGYDQSRSLAEGMIESMVGGAGAGGVVGGITGHVQQARDTATSHTLQALMPEGARVSVDNGVASVEAAGRSFQAPVQTVATALAAGVSFDELADAHTTLLDEVTTYLDTQQRQDTAPAPADVTAAIPDVTEEQRLATKRILYQAFKDTGAPDDVAASSVLNAQAKADERKEPMALWRSKTGSLGIVPAVSKSPFKEGELLTTIYPQTAATAVDQAEEGAQDTLGTETDTPEIQALHKGIADYLNTRIAPGTFAQAETPEAMKRLTPLLETRLGKKIVYFTAKDAPMQIAGVTGIADDIIYINADAKTPHLAVVGHEFLHELKRADAAEYSNTLQAVQKIMPQAQFEDMQAKLEKAHSAEGKGAPAQTLVHEELTADYFGEQFMTKQFWEKVQRNNPQQFVSLAQKFVQFVQKVKDTFTGKQLSDIEKAQDVAVQALRKYAKKNGLENDPRFMRGETSPAGEPATEATFSRIDEAGATTDKQRAEAKRLWQEKGVESPYFKKWFGDSKVVDENGKPLVVYHGTSADISAFDQFSLGINTTAKSAKGAFFFSSSPVVATGYAALAPTRQSLDADKVRKAAKTGMFSDEMTAFLNREASKMEISDEAMEDGEFFMSSGFVGKSNVLPVYISMQNPFVVDFAGDYYRDSSFTKAIKLAQDRGHDGVIFKNANASYHVDYDEISDVYAVFSPTQIKSAIGNRGTFDATDPDITFSRMDEALKQGQSQIVEMGKAALNVKSKLHKLAVEHAPKWLSVMPLQTEVKLFEKTVPQIKSIYDRLNQTVTIKNDLVDVAYVLRDEAHKLAAKTVGVDTFNKAAELGTFNRMLPWEDIYSQEWVPATGTKQQRLQQAQEAWVAAGMQKATKLTFAQAYAESRDAYDALKHDELKQAYKSAVDYMKNIRNRERDNLLAYIESVSDEGTVLRKQLMQRFEASFSDIQGAYWPLSRFGDFTLSYTDTNGFRIFKTFPTYAEALQVKDALIAGGEVEAGNINVSRKDEKTAAETAIPNALMSQLMDAVQAKYTEGISAEDEVAYDNALQRAQSTVQEMNQIWLRWQPETSALKNSMRRGNVKGYDQDMLRGFLNYVQHHASRIAWSEQGRKIEQDMQEMAAEVSERGKGEGATDTALQQAILNDMRQRLQTLNTAKVGWAASSLGKLGTAYFMTSPSIALVQMSQLAVLTLPKLATMYSVKGATTALSKGTVQALSQQYSRDAMFADADVNRLYDMMREAVSQQTRQEGQRIGEPRYTQDRIKAEIAKLTPEQQRLLALREAMARNLLDISATHEAYELTQGKNPDSPLRKAFYYAMAPMRLSELASRKTAVLATFELATEQGKDFFGAMNDIADVVNDTLYSYAKENKGWRMQGGLARVLLMFRHYQIMTAIRMGMLFKDSIKGESAEVRSLARREFAGIMGMTGLLAGSLGLPLSQTIFTILDWVLGDDDEPMDSQLEFTNWLNATLGETAGNVAAKGLPTLVGMDLSRRIGLQDIYGMGQDAPAQLHGSSLAAWHAAHLLGPSYSVFEGWFKGYDQMMNKGNYLRGLEEATPKPIRDMLKAYRTATEGVKTTSGKRLVADEDMGVDEIISMALGFYPDELSKAQANQSALLNMSTRISERRGKLIRKAARAIMEGGDPMEAYEGIRTFNSKMPRFKISSGDVRSAIKARAKGELGTTGVRERAVAQQYGIDALGVE